MGVLSAVLPRFGGGGGGGGPGPGGPLLHGGSGHFGSSNSNSSSNALSTGGGAGRHGSDASRGRPPAGPGGPPLAGGGAVVKAATPTDVRKALHKLKSGSMTVAAFLGLLSRLGGVLPDETLERMVELLSSDKLLPTLLLLLTSDRPAVSAPRATSLDARLPFLRNRKKMSPSISPTSISPATSPQASPISTAVSMDGTTFVVPGQLSIGAPAKARRPKGGHFSRRSASSTDAMYAAADEEQVELLPVPAREEYAANWVAATLIVHGPPALREAILARTGCMATLTAYLDGGVVRPPAVTAVVGQVLCALLHTNRAKVADAFYHTPRLLRNLVRHIGVPCIATLLPRLVAERRGFADREPFDFADPHRRAVAMMGQADDAGAVGRLTAAFVSAAAGGRPRNGHGHHGHHGRRSHDKHRHGRDGDGNGFDRGGAAIVADAAGDDRVRAEAEHAAVGVLTASASTVAEIGVRAMMAARKPAEHEESGDAAFVRHLGLISAGTYNSALDEMDPLVTPGHLAAILDAALRSWQAGSSRSAAALEAALGAITTVLHAVRAAAASGVKTVRVRARALDASALEGVVVSQAAPLLAILEEALPPARRALLTASPSFESDLTGSPRADSVAGGEVGWPSVADGAEVTVPVPLGSTRMAIVDCLYAVVAGGRAGPAAALLVRAGGGRCLLRLADAHPTVSVLTQRVSALVAAVVAAAASPAADGTEDSTEESGQTAPSRGGGDVRSVGIGAGVSGGAGGGADVSVNASARVATAWALLAPAPAGAGLLAWLSARVEVPEAAAATAAVDAWPADGLEHVPATAGASAADAAAWPSHVSAFRSATAAVAAAAAATAAAPPLGGVHPRALSPTPPSPPSRELEQLGEDGGHTLYIYRVVDAARSAASPSALAVDSRERSLTSLVGDAASDGGGGGAPGGRLLFWRNGTKAAGRPSWQARMQ